MYKITTQLNSMLFKTNKHSPTKPPNNIKHVWHYLLTIIQYNLFLIQQVFTHLFKLFYVVMYSLGPMPPCWNPLNTCFPTNAVVFSHPQQWSLHPRSTELVWLVHWPDLSLNQYKPNCTNVFFYPNEVCNVHYLEPVISRDYTISVSVLNKD